MYQICNTRRSLYTKGCTAWPRAGPRPSGHTACNLRTQFTLEQIPPQHPYRFQCTSRSPTPTTASQLTRLRQRGGAAYLAVSSGELAETSSHLSGTGAAWRSQIPDQPSTYGEKNRTYLEGVQTLWLHRLHSPSPCRGQAPSDYIHTARQMLR